MIQKSGVDQIGCIESDTHSLASSKTEISADIHTPVCEIFRESGKEHGKVKRSPECGTALNSCI